MSLLIAIVGAIFAIFSVVIIHEFGHFIVARAMGVRVLKFSIGFGKALWSRTTRQGTEFVIAILPLGGYVRMLGEGDEVSDDELKQYSYSHKSVYARMAIVLAGPVMNFILAILLFWILYLPGVVHIKPVIGRVLPHSIVAVAGVKSGDHIKKIGDETVKNWRAVTMALVSHVGDSKSVRIAISRPPQHAVRVYQLPLSQWKVAQQAPELLRSLGIVPFQPKFPMQIGKVMSGSPADRGGLRQGDRVLAVNDKTYDNMLDLVQLIQKNPNKKFHFLVLRQHRKQPISVIAGSKMRKNQAYGYLGYEVLPPVWPASFLQRETYSVLTAWAPAFKATGSLIRFNIVVLGKMISRKISLRSLGGPITIFKTAGQASQHSYRVYLGFLAFLSVTLGFINLLPIPGLDGGHFFFQLIEFTFRRPVPLYIQSIFFRIGFLLLILLIIQATYNDIFRLIGG
jgi:regulator of sigma E protease